MAFVDVPGHQRFVTALAGMGPAPVAMFVVPADDPWMPQADEHLAALNALDVKHGLLGSPGPTSEIPRRHSPRLLPGSPTRRSLTRLTSWSADAPGLASTICVSLWRKCCVAQRSPTRRHPCGYGSTAASTSATPEP